MSQNFLPPPSWIHINRDLDVAWSREHDEHFKIGHLKSKLPTDHDFLEQFFCFDFFQIGHFVVVVALTLAVVYRHCCWRQPVVQLLLLLSNGDFDNNKRFTYEKINRDPFITLPLNVQFWSAHHVHGTKLHPKRGCRELNSMEVKSFATSKLDSRIKNRTFSKM